MIRTDVRLGWKSIPGHRHQIEGRENEDVVLTSQEHPYLNALMIVADGMGGHPEPRLAAQTAARAAHEFLFQPERLDEWVGRRSDLAALLRRAAEHANHRVRHLALRVPSGHSAEKPPGCTLTVAAIGSGRFAIAHVGDGSVFLLREGRLRPLAGGEARRLGSRPEEFLGRADRIEVETAADAARPGDRLLLCTDGLTRYFGSTRTEDGSPPTLHAAGAAMRGSSLQRLQEVLARPTADPQALASQLTADGRGEQYDDDTTVVIAEIGASREVPDARLATMKRDDRGVGEQADVAPSPTAAARFAGTRAGTRPVAPSRFWRLATGVSLLLAAAALFGWHPWRRAPAEPPPFHAFSGPAVDLSGLPRGGVLLVHPETRRLFVLQTRPVGAPAADEALLLRELRLKPGGGVTDTGASYRLDMRRGLLRAPNGRSYPVTVDGASGLIEIQQAGTLRVESQPPGLPVWIDGLAAGPTPLRLRVRAGRHQVQLRGRAGVLFDWTGEVPAGGAISVSKDTGGQGAGGAAPPSGAATR